MPARWRPPSPGQPTRWRAVRLDGAVGQGDTGPAVRALRDAAIAVLQITTARQVMDLPRLGAILETFRALEALGVATAVLVAAALVMYLQARQRSQIVAYGLQIKMGMSPGSHRHAVLLEVGSMLAAAFVLGVGLGTAAAAILVRRPVTDGPPYGTKRASSCPPEDRPRSSRAR
jgi:hypothetical protein